MTCWLGIDGFVICGLWFVVCLGVGDEDEDRGVLGEVLLQPHARLPGAGFSFQVSGFVFRFRVQV